LFPFKEKQGMVSRRLGSGGGRAPGRNHKKRKFLWVSNYIKRGSKKGKGSVSFDVLPRQRVYDSSKGTEVFG